MKKARERLTFERRTRGSKRRAKQTQQAGPCRPDAQPRGAGSAGHAEAGAPRAASPFLLPAASFLPRIDQKQIKHQAQRKEYLLGLPGVQRNMKPHWPPTSS